MTAFIVRLLLFAAACVMFGYGMAIHRVHWGVTLAIMIFVLIIAGGDLVP